MPEGRGPMQALWTARACVFNRGTAHGDEETQHASARTRTGDAANTWTARQLDGVERQHHRRADRWRAQGAPPKERTAPVSDLAGPRNLPMSPFRQPARPAWSFVCIECGSIAQSTGACPCCDESRVDIAEPAGRQCAVEREDRRVETRAQRVRGSCVPFGAGAGFTAAWLFSSRQLFLEDFPVCLGRGETLMFGAQWTALLVIASGATATVMLACLHALLPSPRLFGGLITHGPPDLPRSLDPSRRARRSVLLACLALALIAMLVVWSYR